MWGHIKCWLTLLLRLAAASTLLAWCTPPPELLAEEELALLVPLVAVTASGTGCRVGVRMAPPVEDIQKEEIPADTEDGH